VKKRNKTLIKIQTHTLKTIHFLLSDWFFFNRPVNNSPKAWKIIKTKPENIGLISIIPASEKSAGPLKGNDNNQPKKNESDSIILIGTKKPPIFQF
jgi:hypothetical protein